MNAIEHLTNSSFGSAGPSSKGTRAAAEAGQFDDILNTVGVYRADEFDEPSSYDDVDVDEDDEPVDDVDRRDARDADRDDRPDNAKSHRDNATVDSTGVADKTPAENTAKNSAEDASATILQASFAVPVATTASKGVAAQKGVDSQDPDSSRKTASTATAPADPKSASAAGTKSETVATASAATGNQVDAKTTGRFVDAVQTVPGAALKLDAQLTQESTRHTSRPLSALIKDASNDGPGDAVALNDNIRGAADQKFAARKNALERQAELKSELQNAATEKTGEPANGKRSTFAERMSDLTERLAQRMQGLETSQPSRQASFSGAAMASANQPAISTPRSGTLPFTMSALDATADGAQAAALAGNRVVQAGNVANQLAVRTPQAPLGTPAEQVSVQIQHGLRTEADRISIRLSPASLGKVEVKLELSPDRTVHAVVTAERPETLDMLARDARTLHRALEDAGLRTDSNSLSFQKNDDGGGSAQQFADRQGRDATRNSAESPDRQGLEALPTDTPLSNRRAAHDGMLDVEI